MTASSQRRSASAVFFSGTQRLASAFPAANWVSPGRSRTFETVKLRCWASFIGATLLCKVQQSDPPSAANRSAPQQSAPLRPSRGAAQDRAPSDTTRGQPGHILRIGYDAAVRRHDFRRADGGGERRGHARRGPAADRREPAGCSAPSRSRFSPTAQEGGYVLIGTVEAVAEPMQGTAAGQRRSPVTGGAPARRSCSTPGARWPRRVPPPRCCGSPPRCRCPASPPTASPCSASPATG